MDCHTIPAQYPERLKTNPPSSILPAVSFHVTRTGRPVLRQLLEWAYKTPEEQKTPGIDGYFRIQVKAKGKPSILPMLDILNGNIPKHLVKRIASDIRQTMIILGNDAKASGVRKGDMIASSHFLPLEPGSSLPRSPRQLRL